MEHLLKIFKKNTGIDASKDKRAIGKLKREVERYIGSNPRMVIHYL